MFARLPIFLFVFGFLPASGPVAAAVPLETLRLEEAERLMSQRNRELQAARRAVEAARAGITVAGARPNPVLSLGLSSLNPQLGIGAGSLRDKTVDTSIRLDQVIERGEKRELRIATARNLESASVEDLADVLRQQRLALRNAYFDLRLAQDRASILRDTAALFERTLEAAELRLRAGDIAAADVARIRVDALRAVNEARASQAELRRAQLALAYLIGAESGAERLRAADPWPAAADRDAGAVSDELIERRPDVRASRKRLDAAAISRDLARSMRTRDVSVGVQYDHYPTSSANTLGGGNSYGMFVSVPLFARYHFDGEIARAEVDFSQSGESLERIRALARTELEVAISDVRAAAERLRRYDATLLAEAHRSAEAAEFAYRSGAIGVMDLLDARRTLAAVQVDAAKARHDYSRALATWQSGAGELQ